MSTRNFEKILKLAQKVEKWAIFFWHFLNFQTLFFVTEVSPCVNLYALQLLLINFFVGEFYGKTSVLDYQMKVKQNL